MQLVTAALLLTSASVAHASFFVTAPVAATTITAGKSFNLTWLADSGATAQALPLASTFGPTHVGLFTGSSTQQTEVQQFGTLPGPDTRAFWPVMIDPTVGPNSDLYFFRFTSLGAFASPGVPLQAFSARFTLKGMNGTFTPAMIAQNAGINAAASLTSAVATASGASATASAVVAGNGGIQTAGAASGSSAHSSSSSSSSASASASAQAASAGRVGVSAGVLVFGAALAVSL